MKQWTLSQSSFNNFLAILDTNRERAGRKYEELRTRLVKFFEWRACRFPDDLADETLDRVARKIDAGEHIRDHVNFIYGVARLLYLETVKEQAKKDSAIKNIPVVSELPEENEQLDCLEACLETLSENSRTLILQYYRDDKQAKIDFRKKLAETLGISLNALRIKSLRVRAKLEECVFKCLTDGAA